MLLAIDFNGIERNLDMQSVDVGTASEEAAHHLDLREAAEIHSQGQYLDTWNHNAWAGYRVRLQCNARKTDY
jgi:hypothetical protein